MQQRSQKKRLFSETTMGNKRKKSISIELDHEDSDKSRTTSSEKKRQRKGVLSRTPCERSTGDLAFVGTTFSSRNPQDEDEAVDKKL